MPDLRRSCAPLHNQNSDAFVLFGAMGDLAHKKIFPALYNMVLHGNLDVPVIGVARAGRTDEHLRLRNERLALDGRHVECRKFRSRARAELVPGAASQTEDGKEKTEGGG